MEPTQKLMTGNGTQPSATWAATGRSADPDARVAGVAAAREALEGRDAKLAVVFCSDRYDIPVLCESIAQECGDAALIGCSTAGEIATSGPGDQGVIVMALGGDGLSVATAAHKVADGGLRKAGASAARCLFDVDDREHKVLLLLTDGLSGDQQEIVRGAYSTVGASVPLVGGCAGDDLNMERTTQLFGNATLEGAVVAAALASDRPFGIGVKHGWRRVGTPMVVTESRGNVVYSLDDRPALDVYLERLVAPPEARNDAAAFTRFALTHPLGLRQPATEEQVRFVGEADFDAGSLICIAEVPQGGMVWLMEGDDDSVLAATDAACRDALAPLDGEAPTAMIAFDCIARRGVLGEEGIRREIERVVDNAGGAPVAGFYTYGEIARTSGVTGFHNQTLVVLAVG